MTDDTLVTVRAVQLHYDKAADNIRQIGDVYATTHDRATERVEAGLVVLTDSQADGDGGGTGQPSAPESAPPASSDAPAPVVEAPAPGTLEPGQPVETAAAEPPPSPAVES